MGAHRASGAAAFPLWAVIVITAVLAFGVGLVAGMFLVPPPPPIVVMVPAPPPPTKTPTPARKLINCLIDQECQS